MAEDTDRTFSHKEGDACFKERVGSVFDALNSIEKKHQTTIDVKDPFEELEGKSDDRERNRPTSSSESLKRKPARVPDHVLHPEKWTKYSLEEDGSEKHGLKGDALNRAVAIKFLEELKATKKEAVEQNNSDNFQFKKPDEEQAMTKEQGNRMTGHEILNSTAGNVNKMPLYEVGIKAPSQCTKQTNTTKEASKEVILTHLAPVDTFEENTDIQGHSDTLSTVDSHELQESKESCLFEDSSGKFKSRRRNQTGIRKRSEELVED